MKLHRVRPGDPVTAAAHNALLEAVSRIDKLTAAPPLELRRLPTGLHLSLARQPLWRLARLAASLAANSQAEADLQWFDGTAWSNAASARITVHDVFANPYLRSGSRLPVLFHEQSGRWLVMQLQNVLFGKLDGPLAQGGSQAVSVWSGPGAGETDTGVNVTAFDWLLSSGQSVPAGRKVQINRASFAEPWYVVQIEGCAV